MVSVTCRTEYLTNRHHRAASAAWLSMLLGLFALVILNIANVSGIVTATVVAALIAVSLGVAAFGRLGDRGAVLLTVDDDTVYVGDEDHQLAGYPLTSLVSVSLGGPADTTTAGSSGDGRDLRVRGAKHLTMVFDVDGKDTWKVAVIDSDPAAAEVIGRLRKQAPERVASKQRTEKKRESGKATSGEQEFDQKDTPGPRIADAGTDEAAERLWEEATRRHDKVLSDYAAYELDPAALLRYPAITDVTVETTQNFHLALDDATALRTDRYPGSRSRADAYQQSVAALRRAWIACEAYGKKVGSGYLEPGDQEDLDTALKLYRHAASSTTPAEQATYYGRVRDIVTSMADRGGLRPPEAAVEELKAVTRRAIEAGEPTH
ncbi:MULTISPECIES: hypothetical protein [unclassified Gordonia (in: high G+C Gram-positive bacteria)]|uniref:hypothetical protein n=1 Tax=unclassified Gordonia (in: high G+C Gram-positive bacteria) TaxID=2657482 RepID=UPI001F0FA8BF|nr:hypothetical protein [Gordonia sp. ABSL49_1]MCH5642676.1 hypothetical protein [Gordonia sp. ABSL49_1]